jgi:predicted nuclease of predicted toxin-antitoxin system
MSLKLYMDAHIPRVITDSLRARGIDVLTAQEDGADELTDPDLLDRATALGRILYEFANRVEYLP